MSEVFQESFKTSSGVCQESVRCIEQYKSTAVSAKVLWALQMSSPNEVSKLDLQTSSPNWRKNHKSLKSLSEIFKEYFRSLSGVCQISVSCNGQPFLHCFDKSTAVEVKLLKMTSLNDNITKLTVKSLTAIHQESIRSWPGVGQESVRCNYQSQC